MLLTTSDFKRERVKRTAVLFGCMARDGGMIVLEVHAVKLPRKMTLSFTREYPSSHAMLLRLLVQYTSKLLVLRTVLFLAEKLLVIRVGKRVRQKE